MTPRAHGSYQIISYHSFKDQSMAVTTFETFTGQRCSGEVHALGGMMAPVQFTLADGRIVSPMSVAPWVNEPEDPNAPLPGIMKNLRGEWPCVPFGMPTVPDGMPADWLKGLEPEARIDDFGHGYSSNHAWTLGKDGEGAVVASIRYPETHPVERLERRVASRADAAVVDMALTIYPRTSRTLPISFHPTLRLPARPGAAKLSFGNAQPRVWTYPIPAEPGRSVLKPDQRGVALSEVLDHEGQFCDILSQPFGQDSEDLLLLTGTDGHVCLDNLDEGYRVTVEWDVEKLPSVMLWLSNQGRHFAPWNGRHRAIGIEPLAGVFDFGTTLTQAQTPMHKASVTTGIDLAANVAWTAHCSIRCDAL
jgi:hypothetical protein